MRHNLRLAPVPDGAECEQPVSVVLADDHASVRRSLRLLLRGEPDVEVVAEGGDPQAAIRAAHGCSPSVLVLDLHAGGTAAVAAIRQLRARATGTEIVVVTMERSPAFAQQMIGAGALGFVLKDRADTELAEAVRRAARGEEYISPHVSARVEALHGASGFDGLTPRELEILRLIAFGHTSAEIAAKLHLSRRTVETHRARIHRKLGVRTRADLVSYALRRRLICD